MKKLTLTIAALSAFATLGISSALAAPPPGTQLAEQQVLTFNLGSFPPTLDPSQNSDAASNDILKSLYSSLTRTNEKGEIVPDAATSWSVSEDGLTWTFKLNPKATWYDGKPVTADQFVYSWRRLVDPKTASPYADYLSFGFVKNVKAINKGELPVEELGIKAIDDHTLEVHLTQPCPWIPSLVTKNNLAPLRQDYIEKYGDRAFAEDNLIGNGPYRLTAYRVNDVITVEKRKDYYDASEIAIEKANYIFISDSTTAYYKFLAGELSVTSVPPTLRNKILQENKDLIAQARRNQTIYLDLNHKSKALSDVKIREAVTLLTDQKLITNTIYKRGIPTSLFTPTYIIDGQLGKQAPYFDLPFSERAAKAKKILEEAGYSKDNPLKLRFLVGKSPLEKRQFIAQQNIFNKSTDGAIQLEIEVVEWKVFLDKLQKSDFDIANDGWGADYDQASTFYNIFLSGSPINYSKVNIPEYDKVVADAAKAQDDTKRAELYAYAGKLLQDNYSIIPIRWASFDYLKQANLKGYDPSNSVTHLRDLYLVKTK